MEAAALNLLEQMVERLIPPSAREAVLGDLRETAVSRDDYLRGIFKTAPFVIASQMARHLNLPVLMLQGALVFWFFSGRAAALALPVLMLREAYQPLTRPEPRAALRHAMLVSFAGLFLGLFTPMPVSQALVLTLLAGPLSLLLCGLRTGLIIGMDRYGLVLPEALPLDGLAACREGFRRRARRRRRLEIAALVLAALCWPGLAGAGPGMPLSAVYLAAAFYLLARHFSADGQGPADFTGLRRRYVEDVRADEQLRRFLCWLWVVPGLIAAQTGLVSGLVSDGTPVTIMFRGLLAVLLCCGAAAINREERGRMQEDISLLGRLREKPSILT
jgi:hypothetical protein